jgi:hypothetical protein
VYARDKMLAALKWREAMGADDLTPQKLLRPLACASLYWHGFDFLGRPILWVRPIRKNWKQLDIEEEKQMHVLMIEYGIRQMPSGTTTFCVVADTKNLGLKHTNSQFLNALLAMITTGYACCRRRCCCCCCCCCCCRCSAVSTVDIIIIGIPAGWVRCTVC